MAKKYNGTINFASALRPTGTQPLDDRMVVQSLTDLMSVDTFEVEGALAVYNGMMVAVLDEQKVFMLVDKTNITSEDSWVAVGSGNGSLAVNTYGEAIALASEDNIGQVIYVTTKSSYDPDGEEGEKPAVEYEAAPYIVIGTGKLMKLAASETNTGNVVSDVAELQIKVSGLETAVGVEAKDDKPATGLYQKIADAQSAAEATALGLVQDDKGVSRFDAAGAAADAKSEVIGESTDTKDSNTIYGVKKYADELNDSMNTRVEELEKIDHSHDNMTVLNDITAEKVSNWDKAQANVIEKIIFNGTEVIVDNQDKSVTLTTPADYITGLAENENVLSVDGGKLSSTLSLNYYKGEGEDAGKYEIQLVGRNNTVVGRVDAKDFVKDGMLNNVQLVKDPTDHPAGTYLVFTWNTAEGVESNPMYVPVTDLIDVYTAGNGLDLDGKTFSISIKDNETYLEVTESGLATKGIDDAIKNAKNALLGADGDAASAGTIFGAKKYAADAADDAKSYALGLVQDDKGVSRFDAAGAAADAKSEVIGESTDTKDSNTIYGVKKYADETFVAKVDGERLMTNAEATKLSGIETGAEVNVIEAIKVNGVDATIDAKKATITIEANKMQLGADITTDGKENNGLEGEESNVAYSANSYIPTVLQGIYQSIRSAVAGGVNSVTASDTSIEVNSADANNPKVGVKVETSTDTTIAEGHIELVKGAEGLYGAMYYDGDDIE